MDPKSQPEQYEHDCVGDDKPELQQQHPHRATAESVDDYSDSYPPDKGRHVHIYVEHEIFQAPLSSSGSPEYRSYQTDPPVETCLRQRETSNPHTPGEITTAPSSLADEVLRVDKHKSVSFYPYVRVRDIPPRPLTSEPRRVHFNPVSTIYRNIIVSYIHVPARSHSHGRPDRSPDRVSIDRMAPMDQMLDQNGDLLSYKR